MVSLVSTRTTRSFLAELLSGQTTHSVYWCYEVILPQVQDFAFPWLNFMRFQFISPLWMAAHPSGVSATPRSFESSANLLTVLSAPSSKLLMKMLLMKMLNNISPSVDRWGTPLVTGLHLEFVPLVTILWAWTFSEFLVHLTVRLLNP